MATGRKHVRIDLTLEQAILVKQVIENARDSRHSQSNMVAVTEDEKQDLRREVVLLSDALLEF